MPYLDKPTNDSARHLFLQRAIAASKVDTLAGNNYLSAATVAEITAVSAALTTALAAAGDQGSKRSRELREKTTALRELEWFVRDTWEGVDRRTRRLKHDISVLKHYDLPLDGVMPHTGGQINWIARAQTIITGDGNAVAAGFPPMANPSAAEVQVALDSAIAETDEAVFADRLHDQAQEAVAALRPQADEMIDVIMLELRLNLRGKSAESQRRIMRTYGATFAYLEGEAVDAEDTAADQPPA